MKKMISLIACMLALVLMLTACGQAAPAPEAMSLASGGVLVLSVNPKIAVEYDEVGKVTGIIARNDDAMKIVAGCTGLIGKSTREAVTGLVTAIGEAGYFVEEIDGEGRKITLEIEPGSSLPNGTFLEDVVSDIKAVVSKHDWTVPLELEVEDNLTVEVETVPAAPATPAAPAAPKATDYGKTDYIDTDYGANNDGITDFDHHDNDATDYGTGSDGVTDFDGTDYDKNTDYGVNADGDTDYGKTDYAAPKATEPVKETKPAKKAETDYDATDYGKTDYAAPKATEPVKETQPAKKAETDYDATDYGKTDYEAPKATEPVKETQPTRKAETDYDATDYGKTESPKKAETDYDKDDSKTDYGKTDYDKNDSKYDKDSKYD